MSPLPNLAADLHAYVVGATYSKWLLLGQAVNHNQAQTAPHNYYIATADSGT